MKRLLCLFVILLLNSCNEKKNQDTILKVDKKWTKDTNGCLGLRNKELAEKLIVKYKLKNTCKNNFIKVFGEPNNIEGNLFEKRLFYLEGSSCENNENNPNSENCFVIFVFQFNELKEFYEQCE